MKKNVGKMYKGIINKKINSIQDTFYSKNKQKYKEPVIEELIEESEENYENMSVEEKIDYILNLPKYLPDFIVEITTEEEAIFTELDRKEGNQLVTKSEARIDIKDIIDIDINN